MPRATLPGNLRRYRFAALSALLSNPPFTGMPAKTSSARSMARVVGACLGFETALRVVWRRCKRAAAAKNSWKACVQKR